MDREQDASDYAGMRMGNSIEGTQIMESIQHGSGNSGNQAEPAHLVLSRREGQTLILQPLGVASEFDIVINFVEVSATKTRIGIRCLRETHILRGEVEDSGESKPSRLGKAWSHFQGHDFSK